MLQAALTFRFFRITRHQHGLGGICRWRGVDGFGARQLHVWWAPQGLASHRAGLRSVDLGALTAERRLRPQRDSPQATGPTAHPARAIGANADVDPSHALEEPNRKI